MMNTQSSRTDGAAKTKPAASAIVVLTPQDAAGVLKVSISFLAKARMKGDGPAYIRIGRSIRYREEDLIAWMNTRRRSSREVIAKVKVQEG